MATSSPACLVLESTAARKADTRRLNSNTCETTPCHIWMSQVIDLARVSSADVEQFCGRDRLGRWFSAGEPVWMAAESLRFMVETAKRESKAERETNYLAGKMKVLDV